MAAQNSQQLLDQLNARILDVSFLLNSQEHTLARILQFRATLSTLDGTEAVFQTLLSLRAEAERSINLLTVLLEDLKARRAVVYRAVENNTRPRPGISPLFPEIGQEFSGAADFITKGTKDDIVWKNIPDNNPADLAGGQFDPDDYKS